MGKAKKVLSGHNVVDNSDWDDAYRLAIQKSQESPVNVDAQWIIAEYYRITEQIDKSIQDCSTIIEHNPNYYLAYYTRGLAYSKIGQHDQAITDSTKTININPKYYFAYNLRGNSHRMQGTYKETIKDCSKAIEICPKFSLAYAIRGSAHRLMKNFKGAKSDLTKSLELEPTYEWAINELSLIK